MIKFGIDKGFELNTKVVDNSYKIISDGEQIVAKGFTDTVSTVQLGLLLGAGIVFYFIRKTDTNKISDMVIEPSKAFKSVVDKI